MELAYTTCLSPVGFFEDGIIKAHETISMDEDKAFGMSSWLYGVKVIFTQNTTATYIDKYFPLTCIIPEGECVGCKRKLSQLAVFRMQTYGGTMTDNYQCALHQLSVYSYLSYRLTFGPYSDVFYREMINKGVTLTDLRKRYMLKNAIQ